MMKKFIVSSCKYQKGFSLIELMVAAMIFTFVCVGVSQLFAQALDIQRRATGYSRIQENALFVLESIAREVRVSAVQSSNGCTEQLTIEHPDHGTVSYEYSTDSTGRGMVTRQYSIPPGGAEPITSDEVDVKNVTFCVSGAGVDKEPARVTIPMTIEAVSARAISRVSVSIQSTIVSRNLVEELTN